MASLSRRACYKCGNVGHYAEVCSSPERLCYNCKQPGKATTLALCYARILNILLTALQDMNQTGAHSPEQQKQSSVTTVKVLAMFKQTARHCA
ncbi:hypothetical protein MMC07_005159 [Pseudocyphellaria aurata]|nr:hypothetical protein [Pseudocyphellaria aurata]